MISVRKDKKQMAQGPGGITVKTQLYSEYNQAVSGWDAKPRVKGGFGEGSV